MTNGLVSLLVILPFYLVSLDLAIFGLLNKHCFFFKALMADPLGYLL